MINLYLYMIMLLMMSIFFYLISLYLFYFELVIMMEWLMFNLNSLNMEVMILLDWVTCLFISVVMLISSMIMLYSLIYMSYDNNINRFVLMLLLFIFSMVLMIMSPNLISILFGWDGLGLSSYCLVIYYQNYISFNSGMITVLSNRVGDLGLMMSISLIFMYGSWNMYFTLSYKGMLIMLMIMIAGITKSAQFPFSVWLPSAMAAPTPVSALVHSSTLVTAGVYLLFRFNSFLSDFSKIESLLLYISVFTMFMAGLMANFEMDLKKIIALSTLSQLGLMMIILSLGEKFLAFFHLLTHAIFKSLLFMCAGIMIHFMNNNQDIRFYGKLNEYIPFTMMSFYVSKLALMGFPFLAGFYSKDLIMESIFMMKFNLFLISFIMLSIMLTVSYSLRLIYYMFFSEFKWVSANFIKEDSVMNLSLIVLLMLSIFGGSVIFWIYFFDSFFIYISLELKFLTLMFMVVGVFMMCLFYMKSYINMILLVYFISSMWMLNYMYMWIYKPFLHLGISGFKIDMEWLEFFEKGLFLNFMKNLKLINNSYNMYMYLFMVMFVLLLVFFFFN